MVRPCVILGLLGSLGFLAAAAEKAILLPTPKRVTWLSGRLRIADAKKALACFVGPAAGAPAVAAGIAQVNERLEGIGGWRLRVTAAADESEGIIWVGTRAHLPQLAKLLGKEQKLPREMCVADGYVLRCEKVGDREAVLCIGHDERGCYYALQTLGQLLSANGQAVSLPWVEIVDWPTYRLRLVKVSATKDDPDVAVRLARLLPRYKLNVYGLQYHPEKGGTWRQPSERYRRVIEKVGEIAKQEAVLEPGLFLCPFFRPPIDLTKKEDVQLYIDRFRWGLGRGCKWIEIDFNDWGTWARLPDAEKALFDDAGDFMATVSNTVYKAIRKDFPDAGVIACTTPSYYRGSAKPELVRFCEAVPEDVLIYWTGPVTRSRRITREQILDWTKKTGRKPFLWDNTLYAHFQPFWVGYAFNPYFNRFPDDLPELLDGPGIHLNASARAYYLPGFLTFADYTWNPEAYNPRASIRNALELLWGRKAPDAAQAVQDRLVALHKWLYEAGKGWRRFDRAEADGLLAALDVATQRLADIAGDPTLAAELRADFVGRARQAIEKFEPPKKLQPRPQTIKRSLSKGCVNPSAEEIADGKPVGWSLYTGAGKAKLVVSAQAHSGKHSACLHATQWYHNPAHATHGDRKWINVALVHGSEGRGFDGRDAYDVEPGKGYRCSFWLKGDVPRVSVQFQGWSAGMGSSFRHPLESDLPEIHPTKDWKQVAATFHTGFDTRKLAVKLGILGYEDEGARLGRIWVDDIAIEPTD